MESNFPTLVYNLNRPKYEFVREGLPSTRIYLERYQPFCCALSGITRLTREAISRLPEYLLVGDPRYNIICRCPCHSADLQEGEPVVICNGKKLVAESPVPPKNTRNSETDLISDAKLLYETVVYQNGLPHRNPIINFNTNVTAERYKTKVQI